MKTKYLLFVAFTALVLTGCKGKGGSSEEPKEPTYKEIADEYRAALENVANYRGSFYFSSESVTNAYGETHESVKEVTLDFPTGRAFTFVSDDNGYESQIDKYTVSEDNPKILEHSCREHYDDSDSITLSKAGVNDVKFNVGRDILDDVVTDFVPADYMYMVDNPTPFLKLIYIDMFRAHPEDLEIIKSEPTLAIDDKKHIDFALDAEVAYHYDEDTILDITSKLDVDVDIKDGFVTNLLFTTSSTVKERGTENEEVMTITNGFQFETEFNVDRYNEIEAEQGDYDTLDPQYVYLSIFGVKMYSMRTYIDTPVDTETVLAVLNYYGCDEYLKDYAVCIDEACTTLFEDVDEGLYYGDTLYIRCTVKEGYSWITYEDVEYELPETAAFLSPEDHQYFKENNILFYCETYYASGIYEIGDTADAIAYAYFPFASEFFVDDEQVFGLTFVTSKPHHVVKSIGYCYGSWGYYFGEPIYFEDNGFFIGKTACVSVTGMYESSNERFFAVNANKLEKGKELTIGVYASDRVCDEEHPVPTTEPLEVEVNVYISTSEDPVTQIPEDYEGYVTFGVRHNNSDDLPYFSYLVVA